MLEPITESLPKNLRHATLRQVVTDKCKELYTLSSRSRLHKLGFQTTQSAPRHKNGLAQCDERMRAIQDITSKIMYQNTATSQQIPDMEHTHARRYVMHIINRLPMKDDKTPYEKLWNVIPDLTEYPEFYTPVWVKLYDGPERKKSNRFSAKARLGYVLGKPPGGRGALVRLLNGNETIRHEVYFMGEILSGMPIRKLLKTEMDKLTQVHIPVHPLLPSTT